MSTALHIALCSLPYSSRLEANQRAGALSLFVIVSALRAYKQLRVPLAWRGGTKKTAAGRINKKIAAENKKSSYTGPLVPVHGTNRYQCRSLVPVCWTNRDECSSLVPCKQLNTSRSPLIHLSAMLPSTTSRHSLKPLVDLSCVAPPTRHDQA